MADATWPTDLPQEVHQNGFQMEIMNGSIRTDMETGKAFQRPRFTATVEPFRGKIWLDSTEYTTFYNFYKTTLRQGALPFNWKHPITGDTAELRFNVSNPPQITPLSGDQYEVTMNLEVLP